MFPAVENNATASEIAICFVQSIKAVGDAVATLVAFGNKGTTNRREVRAVEVREASIGGALVRLWRATAVAYGAAEYRLLLLETPSNKTPTTRVVREVDKEGYLGIIALLGAKCQQLFGALGYPTSQAHHEVALQVVEHPLRHAP